MPTAIRPLAPGRYRVQFTASTALRDKIERLRVLMRSQVPDGDLGALIEAAVTEKLQRLEARRFGSGSARRAPPRTPAASGGRDAPPSSRYVPAAVRRAVYRRDGGRCRFVDDSGRRCEQRHALEFHHVHPFGFGGGHRPENVRLMCRAHNARLAEHDYGRQAMARMRRAAAPNVAGAAPGSEEGGPPCRATETAPLRPG